MSERSPVGTTVQGAVAWVASGQWIIYAIDPTLQHVARQIFTDLAALDQQIQEVITGVYAVSLDGDQVVVHGPARDASVGHKLTRMLQRRYRRYSTLPIDWEMIPLDGVRSYA